MNPVKNAITSLVTKITSIPANLRGAAKEQIANSVELGAEIAGVQLAEIVSEMIKGRSRAKASTLPSPSTSSSRRTEPKRTLLPTSKGFLFSRKLQVI